jgi:hypothetical protein
MSWSIILTPGAKLAAHLKVVSNEKVGGVRKVANDRYWLWTVVIDVLFSLATILE